MPNPSGTPPAQSGASASVATLETRIATDLKRRRNDRKRGLSMQGRGARAASPTTPSISLARKTS
jgi:hypothetical protein